MNHSKSGLFLMELIISILFFSLASAVCVRLFAHAHLISQETVEQNNAVTNAQNLAETWYATKGSLADMQKLLTDSVLSMNQQSICIFFDQEWNSLQTFATTPVSYIAELDREASTDDGMIHGKLRIYRWKNTANEAASVGKAESSDGIVSVEEILSHEAFRDESEPKDCIYTLELQLAYQ